MCEKQLVKSSSKKDSSIVFEKTETFEKLSNERIAEIQNLKKN